MLGDEDLAAVGEAHADAGDQLDHLAANGDGREAGAAADLAHHDGVHHVVELLQNIGKDKGNGKGDELPGNVALGVVDDDGFFF